MGNAVCKVCGSDKGLRPAGSLSNLDQNPSLDYYCVEHFPGQPALVLVRAQTGTDRAGSGNWGIQSRSVWGILGDFLQIRRFLVTFFKVCSCVC